MSPKIQEAMKRRRQSPLYKKNAREYSRKKKLDDEQYRLSIKLRQRLNSAVKRNYISGKTIDDLGCSIEAFKLYIERQFKPGMSWENREKWHLDHIRPLSSFNLSDQNQFSAASHYTNIQPLWPKENLAKNEKHKLISKM